MPTENNNGNRIKGFNGYVPWVIFVFVISMSVFLFNGMSAQVKTNTNDITNIKVFIGATNATLTSIDKTLIEIKTELKNNNK